MTEKEEQILHQTEQFVQEKLTGEASGHDWWHIGRVRNLAKRIATEEGADSFVCQLTALLHDIADEKIAGTEEAGLAQVQAWLDEQEVEHSVQETVLHIIKHMSYKGGTQLDVQLTLEGQVVQDADRLDAIGAIGIARTMAFSGNKGRLIHDPNLTVRENMTLEEYRSGKDTAILHFYEKLLKLKELMNTETAKKLAAERHVFLENYLEQFYAEWEGKR
ncbi:HD domain-containing protein [Streptococcus sp. X16XC17]|uniref:HD domain-containing protein n=1 Tax=Streptococcus sp. X16XC17 TaxID=2316646 RepID=UPI0010394F61|nr:HD domain-containing protein [Streptococcus sp. X16XC17]TCD46011.1 HD domain-containing protein [Streptococcus sp. X16XC17]